LGLSTVQGTEHAGLNPRVPSPLSSGNGRSLVLGPTIRRFAAAHPGASAGAGAVEVDVGVDFGFGVGVGVEVEVDVGEDAGEDTGAGAAAGAEEVVGAAPTVDDGA
jgi:hypothetical protein